MRTLVWRRLDEPGMEAVHVGSLSQATGVQIGRTYELHWRLDDERLELDLNGDRRTSVGLDGADFFDVSDSTHLMWRYIGICARLSLDYVTTR